MTRSANTASYKAVSMEFSANFGERRVETHVLSDTGRTIAVSRPSNSVFAIKRRIEQLGDACLEIATWGRSPGAATE